MNLRNLRYFVSVAEMRRMSAAAERLQRSQSAVSRAIQELEAELGFALFLREGRRTTPSVEAQVVLPQVRAVLRDTDDLGERARQLASSQASVLRIGGAASTVESVLPRVIAAFKQLHPTVEIVLSMDSGSGLLAALEQGELDVIATREVSSERLQSRRILPMHVVAVLCKGHPLATGRGIAIEDLLHEDLMLGPRSFTSRILFDAACRSVDTRPRVVLESPHQRALVALAEVGHGIAIVPSTVSLAGHVVKARPIRADGRPIGTWTSLIWDRQRRAGAVESFVDLAAKLLQEGYPGASLRLPPLAAGQVPAG